MHYLDNGLGITEDSLRYYREGREELGRVITARVTSAALCEHPPYTFELHDDQGNHMWLSGLAAGSGSAAARAAMDVLIEVGFDADVADLVLTDREVELRWFDPSRMCQSEEDRNYDNRFPATASRDKGRGR
jgi:hypothetical protein